MKKVLLILVIVIIAYVFWARMGRSEIENYEFRTVEHFTVFKKDSSFGNIVGIQPHMTNFDYQSKTSFYKRLDFYLNEAKMKNWLHKNTTVVFPEHIASWLVAAGEKSSVYHANKINDAMRIMVLSNISKFFINYIKSDAEDKATDAVFQMKANRMVEIYQSVFSRLAKKYEVNIIAGSIFLPNPSVMDNQLMIGDGDIYNMSAVFLPNGKIDPMLIKKKYPVSTELPFCVKSEEDLPTYTTTSGNLGVAICADSWYGEIYDALNKHNITTFIVPSYSTGYGWDAKWQGYDGSENPIEVDKSDIDNLTLEKAWHKYTIKRIEKTKIKTGITVFLRGNIWDLGTDGSSFIFRNDSISTVPKTDGPVLFNVEI